MNLPPDSHASELLDVFFESAEELLQGMNGAGLALEEKPNDLEQLRYVRRAVHTLKGDSATCGFRELSEIAHCLEDVLTPELAQQKAEAVADIVLSAADTFGEMLAAYRRNSPPPSGGMLRDQIRRLLDRAETVVVSEGPKFEWTEYERLLIAEACQRGESVYHIALYLDSGSLHPASSFELAKKAVEGAGKLLALKPRDAKASGIRFMEVALSSSQAIDWIKRKCQVPAVVEKLLIEKVDMPGPGVAERDALQVLLEAEAAAISQPVKTPPQIARGDDRRARKALPVPGAGQGAVESALRVDTARIDSVMNLVGELIIGKSMLHQAIVEFEKRHSKDPLRAKMSDALAFQSRILAELQKSVMKIRMVPVEQLFRRFPRMVRDVGRLLHKEIDLEIAGENTDLDKTILDALSEPLAHLVRNAADHGIEQVAEREAAGKSARGTIRLNAYHDGDQVVIEVCDDGQGLNGAKIARLAVEKGIVTAEEALRFTEFETLQLIFRPGFSTAEQITEISGRGVGLDVVKSVIENLKGTVEVKSERGHGSTFRLLVPLTLASIQALLFRAGGCLYAVPLASVIEITRITEEDIHRVDDHEVFQLRKQLLTLIRLDQLAPEAVRECVKRIFVVVVGSGTRRFGLIVDSLMGEEELVIKALEDELVTSPLVSGASILGDGTVVLILNIAAVVAHLSKVVPQGVTA